MRNINQIHVNGFDHQQIWEQAKRILDTSITTSAHDIDLLAQLTTSSTSPTAAHSPAEPSETDSSEENTFTELESPASGGEDSDADDFASISEGSLEENVEPDTEKPHDATTNEKSSNFASTNHTTKPDPFGLNDGFFSLDEFNKQSALLEKYGAKGASGDIASDEEEVDWDADPFGANASPDNNDSDASDSDLSMAEDEAEGPDGGEGSQSPENIRNAKYGEFFAPPQFAPSETKSKQDTPSDHESETLEDVERAIADVRRDLFEDDMESDDDEDGHGNSAGGPKSTHEKRRAQITDEIRQLEAANVAKKDWTLIGEANAGQRPHNSLLEEDLEFERLGKPVPVVTAETTDDIESMIKQRIISKEFDGVIKRHSLAVKDDSNRKKFTLDETKSQKNLAELYENDLRATDKNYVGEADKKLQKEHEQINHLWNDISSQLDKLTNSHFRPRRPQADINVVSNVDTIFMEDAQPTTHRESNASGALAPQEVYTPSDRKAAGEIMLKNGASLATDEVTRDDKLRHRRRERQKKKKRSANSTSEKPASKSSEKKQVVSDLKKGGVKVIGKGGSVAGVDGNDATTHAQRNDALKL